MPTMHAASRRVSIFEVSMGVSLRVSRPNANRASQFLTSLTPPGTDTIFRRARGLDRAGGFVK